MKKTPILLSFLLLSVGWLAACGGNGATTTTYVTHTSSNLNLSFDYPESWAIEEKSDEINVASDSQLLSVNEETPISGAVVHITTLPPEVVSDNVVSTLEEFVAVASEGNEENILKETTALTVNEQEAATATLAMTSEEGTAAVMMVTMISGEGQAALVTAVYDDDRLLAQLEHIAHSLELLP